MRVSACLVSVVSLCVCPCVCVCLSWSVCVRTWLCVPVVRICAYVYVSTLICACLRRVSEWVSVHACSSLCLSVCWYHVRSLCVFLYECVMRPVCVFARNGACSLARFLSKRSFILLHTRPNTHKTTRWTQLNYQRRAYSTHDQNWRHDLNNFWVVFFGSNVRIGTRNSIWKLLNYSQTLRCFSPSLL